MKKRRIFSLITALTFAAAPLVTAFHMRAAESTFMLDAGHGGSDSGAVYNGRLEKNDNLRITLAVGERLARSGERVLYTRTDDSTVDLTYRSTMANSAGATYFVSFHRNSASTVGRGVEVSITPVFRLSPRRQEWPLLFRTRLLPADSTTAV